MDMKTLEHLALWVKYEFPIKHEDVYTDILNYMRTLDADDVEYMLSKGWWYVYDNATQIGQSK